MTLFKKFIAVFCIFLAACSGGPASHTLDDKASLVKTTEAIRVGFAKGDVNAVLQLHHPDVLKYFGGKNIVRGRAGLKKQLTDMFNYANVEFVQNDIESTVFNDSTAIETCLYGIRVIPKNGDSVRVFHGRSMVVYVRYKDSPTGWISLREMTQDAPAQ